LYIQPIDYKEYLEFNPETGFDKPVIIRPLKGYRVPTSFNKRKCHFERGTRRNL